MKNTRPLPVTSLDFDDLKSVIQEFIKNQTDFNSYNYLGSNLSMLLDILAYNSQFTAYNINMVANELSLETSTFRDNVVSIAKRLGYQPKTYTSSKVNVTLSSSSLSAYDYVKINPGTVLSSTNEGKTYLFLSNTVLTATVNNGNASFNNIELKEGQFFDITYIVDYSDENQRFIIPNTYVDSDSITVTVQNIPYTRKKDILNVNSSSTIFFVDQIQDQKLEVIFGDNIIGRKLENGETVQIKYIITNGSIANGLRNFSINSNIYGIKNNQETTLPGNTFSLTINSENSYGGSDFESISSIKYNAPRYYSAQNRAVTLDDYEIITRRIYPNIDLIRVIGGESLNPPEYGKVYISIKPAVGEIVNNFTRNLIINELRKYIVGSVVPIIISPESINIILFITALFQKSKTTLSEQNIIALLINAVSSYANSDTIKTFEGTYDNSKLQCELLDTEESISSIIVRPLIKKIIYPNINQECKYSFCLRNKLKNNLEKITFSTPEGFYVNGIAEKVYIVDDNKGNLILKRYIGSKLEPIGIIGNIDYETGCFDFILNISSDTPINIIANPDSTIITAPPNTFLDVFIPGTDGTITLIDKDTYTPNPGDITDSIEAPNPIRDSDNNSSNNNSNTNLNLTRTIDDFTPEINPLQCN